MSQKQKDSKAKKLIPPSSSPQKGLPEEAAIIIKFLKKQDEKPTALGSIYRHFKDKLPKKTVEEALAALIAQGVVRRHQSRLILLPSAQSSLYVVGKVDYVNPSYAYVVVGNGEQDILVRQWDLLSALDQDEVKVLVLQPGLKKRHPLGKVVEILKRSDRRWLGTLRRKEEGFFVEPTSKRMHQDIFIGSENLQGAKPGDRVAVALASNSSTKGVEGKVVRVFGPLGHHDTEMHMIMAEFDLPTAFPPAVVAQAAAIANTFPLSEVERRRDYRGVLTLTIDPEDAKDFDDALSLQVLPDGNFEVGVHIADVSYYVPMGTEIDQEAFERGTSVYLVDRTIPMLPERLSNDLCSLRPQEDRLAFAAVFELDAAGNLQKEWFGETVIHSQRRLTYAQAQQAVENSGEDLHKPLVTLNELAKKLRADRFKNGSINFDTPSIKFQLDEHGKPLSVLPYVSQDSHRLIEEFMLLANKRVALHVRRMQQGKQFPAFVYRAHDQPDFDKLADFALFVKQFGHTIQTGPGRIAQSINMLSEKLAGKPESSIIQTLAIRLMARACYTTAAKPHFGLAFEHYTHFTSPIRRYPDLVVHRLLKRYLKGKFDFNAASYEKQCQHASERERIATEAERASIKYKQVELMQAAQGKHFKGIISSMAEWGMYVGLVDFLCEGLVRLSDMADDYYVLEAKQFRLVGQRTKKIYRLGDWVEVVVKGCDITKRTIDLLLVDGKDK
jgi:ribonuclease R